jgi:hypothetical protein
MTEREQQIAELLNEGWTREKAERQFLDDDLWIIRPLLRYTPTSEGEIVEWEAAVAQMEVFEQAAARGGLFANDAVDIVVMDAAQRAREILHRGRERLKQAETS